MINSDFCSNAQKPSINSKEFIPQTCLSSSRCGNNNITKLSNIFKNNHIQIKFNYYYNSSNKTSRVTTITTSKQTKLIEDLLICNNNYDYYKANNVHSNNILDAFVKIQNNNESSINKKQNYKHFKCFFC